MLNRLLKTPRNAAFFCTIILTGCTPDQSNPETLVSQCPTPTTPIASVQGDGLKSPVLGQQVTVQGIVTLIQNTGGLYIEEPDSDTNEGTSNAIFIQPTQLTTGITLGALVSARGKVVEIGEGHSSLTALTDVDALILCTPNQVLPLTDITLPLNGFGREAFEGMRIQVNDTLTVTDVYKFGQGHFTLSGNGIQFVPTEVTEPGPDAARLNANNRAFALPAMLANDIDHPALLFNGKVIERITGVVAHDERGLRVSLQSVSSNPVTNFAPPTPAAANSLRVVGMNLHNYFNGNGHGLGFPTPRGAKTAAGFQNQRARIGAAIRALNPHIIGVMELENDGFGPASAAEDFIQLANTVTQKSWAVTRPVADNTGTDKITVGLFYRSDQLKAIGPAQTLTGPEFQRSRQPQAQLFQQLPDGGKILLVINHLKSKGSCPVSGDNADQKDGQGCWNPMRLASAKKMSAWASDVAASTGTDNILILGDMNAYRNEDPIDAIRTAGFMELMDQKVNGKKQEQPYSFAYFGQHGTLDYAFSSPALLEKVQQTFIWHVNAALPANMELPQPWLGFSDHDPMVVDLLLRQ